jgi:hypothetical protein
MTRDKLLRELHRMLATERISSEWDALHAAIELLTLPTSKEIEAARAFALATGASYSNLPVWATLEKALDTLARVPALEARLAKAGDGSVTHG